MALTMGDVVTATVEGKPMRLVLDDVVYPDRTCGQYEAGWWVFPEGTENDPDGDMYFLSLSNGAVWDNNNREVGRADIPDPLDWEV